MLHNLTQKDPHKLLVSAAVRGGAALVALMPLAASAQKLGEYGTTFLESLGGILELLIPIVFALILLAFFWGLAKFVFGASEAKESGKSLMLWSVIALFIAASIWGIVNLLQGLFGATDQSVTVPNVNLGS
jgi:hypothetical protein